MANIIPGKKYGLIMPKKAGGATAMGQPNLQNKLKKKASIFNQSDSDSDQSGMIFLFY